jgi:hypothetical protein
MADIPKDPRQLARDILAGKISIEDLAREQARRAGRAAAPPGVPTPQKLPDRIPLPRPAQPPPAQRKPTAPAPQQSRRSAPSPQQPSRRKTGRTPPPVNLPPPARQQLVSAPQASMQEEAAPTAHRQNRPTGIQAALRTRGSLRQAILMAEILNKPVSLREE